MSDKTFLAHLRAGEKFPEPSAVFPVHGLRLVDAYTTRSTAAGGMICQFDYLSAEFPLEQAKRALAEVKENQNDG